jgi:hypothetical protein
MRVATKAIFPWPWPVTACLADTGRRVRHKDPMPVIGRYLIVLTSQQESVVIARARSVRGAYCDRLRAPIVLAAAAGGAPLGSCGYVICADEKTLHPRRACGRDH